MIFIAGIFIASFLPAAWLGNRLFLFTLTVATLAGSIIFWRQFSARSALLALSIFFFALWRFSLTTPENTPDKIWFYNGQRLTILAQVAAEPDSREKNTRYTLTASKIIIDGTERRVEGKILYTAGFYPRYSLGDELSLVCALSAPEKFDGFAYDRYLARFGVYSVCDYPQVNAVDHSSRSRSLTQQFYNKLAGFKDGLRSLIGSGLSEPEASLAAGLVLGDQKGLPPDLKNDFAASGLSHIVAISGMNITFLSVFILNVLLAIGFWRGQTFYLTNFIIFGYILLIGLPPSAMRAGLMSFLLLLALRLGRLSKLTNSLILAGALMIMHNPLILRDDLGFQLSFLALLGIIYFYPQISGRLSSWLPDFLHLPAEIFSMTVAAQILTAPILIYNFSQLSLIAPVANLLALWSLPILMILIFLSLGLSLVWPLTAHLFFLPAYALLKYLIAVARTCADLPGAALAGISIPWPVWLLYYSLIFWFIRKTLILKPRMV